jgi:TonB family protein
MLTVASGAWRRTVNIDGKSLQEVSSDTWKSVADDGFLRPVMEELLWSLLIHPIPSADVVKDRSISLHTEKSDSGTMQCAVLGQIPGTPAGTYCFRQEPELLSSIESAGGFRASLSGYKKAGPVYIPTQISVSIDRSTVALLRVTSLSSLPNDPALDMSLADPGEHQVTTPQHIAALDQAEHTKWTSKPAPRYPQIAKELHISGTVFLLVTIAEDGSVKSIQPLASPHDSLTESSAAAVAKWRWEPQLIDGKPVQVDALMRVNYSFNQ